MLVDGRTMYPLRASSRDTMYLKSSPGKVGDVHDTIRSWVLMLKDPIST